MEIMFIILKVFCISLFVEILFKCIFKISVFLLEGKDRWFR
ncbi:hypothetical protein [Clostridium perfringens]|nr:hypothetical protein [Clostridium perfringens]MDU7977744.1 hypothetical protein [Clostridioides difficile]MDK0553677.1 hypothetical protein [Clostridium perfringens]MDK0575124.1 hypothetical protein [Clostridium perfringens]MDK0834794.1 hypothetical protein [Clostridium perfringens]MDK0838689.1 hypothetical protein [Clostridium perfringens]